MNANLTCLLPGDNNTGKLVRMQVSSPGPRVTEFASIGRDDFFFFF